MVFVVTSWNIAKPASTNSSCYPTISFPILWGPQTHRSCTSKLSPYFLHLIKSRKLSPHVLSNFTIAIVACFSRKIFPWVPLSISFNKVINSIITWESFHFVPTSSWCSYPFLLPSNWRNLTLFIGTHSIISFSSAPGRLSRWMDW